MDKYSSYLTFAKKIAIEAGSVLSSYFGNINLIHNKSTPIDLVTEADLKSEEFLVKAIQEKYHHHTIITEETHLDEKKTHLL